MVQMERHNKCRFARLSVTQAWKFHKVLERGNLDSCALVWKVTVQYFDKFPRSGTVVHHSGRLPVVTAEKRKQQSSED